MKYLRASGDLLAVRSVLGGVAAEKRRLLCPLHETTDAGHCERETVSGVARRCTAVNLLVAMSGR